MFGRRLLGIVIGLIACASADAANTSRPTGRGAIQDDSVYCQNWPGHSSRPAYRGTGPQTPFGADCGPPSAPSEPPWDSGSIAGSHGPDDGCWAGLPAGKLCTEDGAFKDGHGNTVILRGVNLAGNSKVPPFLPLPTGDAVAFRIDRGGSMVTHDFDFLGNTSFQALDSLPSWGMNVIRLLFVWEAYEPVRGERSLAYIEMLKAIANEAWQRGIYTIIDFHQDVFARWLAGGCGEGFPRWALPFDDADPTLAQPRNDGSCADWMAKGFQDPKVHGAFHNLYQGWLRDDYLGLMADLARKFRDLPGVIGFDPLNEPLSAILPVPSSDPLSWLRSLVDVPTSITMQELELCSLYQDVARVFAREDPQMILFLEPNLIVDLGVQTDLCRPPDYPFVAYAPHYYDPDITTLRLPQLGIGLGYRLPTRTMLAFGNMSSVAKRWDAPLFLGEFGAPITTGRVEAYMDLLYDQLDRYFASGAQWSFTPGWTPEDKDGWNGEDLSIVDTNGLRLPLFRPRPYPQQISGVPKRIEVRSSGGQTTLDLEWEHRPTSFSDETVIFVPERAVRPAGPAVSPSATADCAGPMNPARLFNDPNLLQTVLGCMMTAAGPDAAEGVSIDTHGVPLDQLYCAVGPDALHVTCYASAAGRTFHVTIRYAG